MKVATLVVAILLCGLCLAAITSPAVGADNLVGTWEGTATIYQLNWRSWEDGLLGQRDARITADVTMDIWSQSGSVVTGIMNLHITSVVDVGEPGYMPIPTISGGIIPKDFPGPPYDEQRGYLTGSQFLIVMNSERWEFDIGGGRMIGKVTNTNDMYFGFDSDAGAIVLEKTSVLGGGTETVVTVGVLAAGIFSIAAAALPSPKPQVRPQNRPPQPFGPPQQAYAQPPPGPQPTAVWHTQPPDGTWGQSQSQGGIGFHYAPPINAPRWAGPGEPPRPSDWYRQRIDNSTPECPVCLTVGMKQYLRPIFAGQGDPGIWVCDACGRRYGGS